MPSVFSEKKGTVANLQDFHVSSVRVREANVLELDVAEALLGHEALGGVAVDLGVLEEHSYQGSESVSSLCR